MIHLVEIHHVIVVVLLLLVLVEVVVIGSRLLLLRLIQPREHVEVVHSRWLLLLLLLLLVLLLLLAIIIIHRLVKARHEVCIATSWLHVEATENIVGLWLLLGRSHLLSHKGVEWLLLLLLRGDVEV